MKKLLSLFTIFSFSFANAQSNMYNDMLNAMSNSVKGRVLIFAPTITDVKLADTIRQTTLDTIRKTKVKIVTIQYYNFTPKSTVFSLALANVPVYEVQTPASQGVIIIDNNGWKGQNLGRVENPTMQRMTPQEINSMLKWFEGTTVGNKRITQYEALIRLKEVLK